MVRIPDFQSGGARFNSGMGHLLRKVAATTQILKGTTMTRSTARMYDNLHLLLKVHADSDIFVKKKVGECIKHLTDKITNDYTSIALEGFRSNQPLVRIIHTLGQSTGSVSERKAIVLKIADEEGYDYVFNEGMSRFTWVGRTKNE